MPELRRNIISARFFETSMIDGVYTDSLAIWNSLLVPTTVLEFHSSRKEPLNKDPKFSHRVGNQQIQEFELRP